MTPGDREALEAIMRRLDHVASIVQILSRADDTQLASAIGGVGEIITDAAERLDKIVAGKPV